VACILVEVLRSVQTATINFIPLRFHSSLNIPVLKVFVLKALVLNALVLNDRPEISIFDMPSLKSVISDRRERLLACFDTIILLLRELREPLLDDEASTGFRSESMNRLFMLLADIFVWDEPSRLGPVFGPGMGVSR
jgi:hypothetical protein